MTKLNNKGKDAMFNNKKKELSIERQKELLAVLENRFEKNMHRHKGLEWKQVLLKLEADMEKLWSLNQMELTGGEPDVVSFDQKNNQYIFFDCSVETPKDRRNICYDREALDKRKQNKPHNSAMDMAFEMGIEILTEEQYRFLQQLGSFDTKISSWLKTPDNIRKLGGALFGDRRYNSVFIYHNGADSYYSVRGFRGFLKV